MTEMGTICYRKMSFIRDGRPSTARLSQLSGSSTRPAYSLKVSDCWTGILPVEWIPYRDEGEAHHLLLGNEVQQGRQVLPKLRPTKSKRRSAGCTAGRTSIRASAKTEASFSEKSNSDSDKHNKAASFITGSIHSSLQTVVSTT